MTKANTRCLLHILDQFYDLFLQDRNKCNSVKVTHDDLLH